MMLSFDAYDSFKSNLPSTGRWWLSRTDSSGNEEVVGSDEIIFRRRTGAPRRSGTT